MTYRAQFDAKISDTPFSAVFQFALDFVAGETISTASVAATVYSGTDASPSSIISGSAQISGGQVTQVIVNGVAGVTYLLTCSVVTSLAQSLSQEGYLVVVPVAL